jgi:AcrR family transcriptional regulator
LSDAPVARRRRLPPEQRRREVIEAAQRVFIRDGLEGARTREIAREAGVNIATVFHYFPTKEELFEAAVIAPLEDFANQQFASSRTFAKGGMRERREMALLSNEHELALMVRLFPLLTAALFANRQRGTDFYRRQLYPRILALADGAREALPDWEKRGLDPTLIALVGFAIPFMLAMDSHYRGALMNVSDTAKKATDLLLFGILGRESADPPEKGG